MSDDNFYIELKLDVDAPIEVSDFTAAFTALAAEYERHYRTDPELGPNATLFVKEVKQGSIIATLQPYIPLLANAHEAVSMVMLAEDFIVRYGQRISTYLKKGARLPDVSKSELVGYMKQVSAIANNPGSRIELAAVEIKEGRKSIRSVVKFTTEDSRKIKDNIEDHLSILDRIKNRDYNRVLMFFTQSNTKISTVGKKSGELVMVEDIHSKPLSLIYGSDIAEQRIKHEIVNEPDNIYKKGFVVDVIVVEKYGRPVAYSVTNVHQVIDL